MGWLALLGTSFVIRSRLCFLAEELFALFTGYCTIAQFSVLESVFQKERSMIYVLAELALRIRQSRLWDVTSRHDTPPLG
jgi:hypothetical protein